MLQIMTGMRVSLQHAWAVVFHSPTSTASQLVLQLVMTLLLLNAGLMWHLWSGFLGKHWFDNR